MIFCLGCSSNSSNFKCFVRRTLFCLKKVQKPKTLYHRKSITHTHPAFFSQATLNNGVMYNHKISYCPFRVIFQYMTQNRLKPIDMKVLIILPPKATNFYKKVNFAARTSTSIHGNSTYMWESMIIENWVIVNNFFQLVVSLGFSPLFLLASIYLGSHDSVVVDCICLLTNHQMNHWLVF